MHLELTRARLSGDAREREPTLVLRRAVLSTTDLGKLCVCVYAFCSMQAASNAMDVFKGVLVKLCSTSKKNGATKGRALSVERSPSSKVMQMAEVFESKSPTKKD